MELIKKFSQFIKRIKPEDKIAILYDTDSDGICSAVIASKSLEKLGYKVERYIPCSHANFNQVRLKGLRDEEINKIIILDFAADQYPEFKDEADLFDEVLLLDHHKIYKDLNSKKIVFIKSQFLRKDLDGSDYCTSKLTFDLFSSVIKINDLDWLSAIGLVTDMSSKPWMSFLKKVYKNYNLNEKKMIEMGCIIDAGRQIDPPQIERALEMVLEAQKPADIIKSDFSKHAKLLRNEIDFWINKFEEKAERKKDLWLYEIDPSGRIGSVVSTILAIKYPNDSIIIIRRQNGWVSINARNHNSRRPVNELLEKATKNLKGANAGGHIPAAGGAIREKDFDEFKKRLWKLA
jgi:single-stranded DNA-specific DHH superfamily exonuclease